MKFFNPMNRKNEYIFSGVQEVNIDIDSVEYLGLDLKNQYEKIKEIMKDLEFTGFAVYFKVNLTESPDSILYDEDVFSLFTNILTEYSRKFPKQDKLVKLPSETLLKKYLASPVIISLATTSFIVDKPVQISLFRKMTDGSGEEEIRFA